MDFSNWQPSPPTTSNTTSHFFGDFNFTPLNTPNTTQPSQPTSNFLGDFNFAPLNSSKASAPTNSIAPTANLFSSIADDDDFVEFSEPEATKNSSFDFSFSSPKQPNNSKTFDDDFDFDFTPGKKVQAPSTTQKINGIDLATKLSKPVTNTFVLPISDSSPTSPAFTPKHSHVSLISEPIPSYNPFGPSTTATSLQPKSAPIANYNPFGSPTTSLNASPSISSSKPEQASPNSNFFGSPLTPSPLGSLGDILDRDERGELERQTRVTQPVIVQQPNSPSKLSSPIQNNGSEKKSNLLMTTPSVEPVSSNHHNTKPTSGGKPKTMEIEWTNENLFLCIIDQPKVEKSGFSKTPSFRISTKVLKPHPFLKEQFYQVRRTVSDIEFLHKHLSANHQFLILPPLPHKKDFSKSLFDDESDTSNQQCKNYQNFMTRIGRHPVFSKLADVADFLTKTPEEFEAKRKAKHEYSQNYPPATGGWFSSNTPTLKDDKLVAVYKQISSFKEYMKTLQSSAETIRKKYIELNNAYVSFSDELKKMPMAALLKPESGATFSSNFNSSFDSFIIAFDDTSKKMTIQSRLNENLLDERIETWVLYCAAACDAIERFSTLELALKEVHQSMERREERLNVFKKNLASKSGSSSVEEQKLKELTESFEKAETNFKSLSTLYSSARTALYVEIQQFDKYKLNEINTWIEYYGESQYTQLLYLTKSWSFYSQK